MGPPRRPLAGAGVGFFLPWGVRKYSNNVVLRAHQ